MRILLLLVLVAVVIMSAIAVVYARHESRLQFVELTRLSNERDDLNYEFGRLQLEQATWAENNRVEQIARGRLGMISPSGVQMVEPRR
ncbi:MAG: cell division protein FtsL [Dokdonella sp.]